MAKSRRGGKRQGAGRKPMLSAVERLERGAEVEARLAQEAEYRRAAMVEARTSASTSRKKGPAQ